VFRSDAGVSQHAHGLASLREIVYVLAGRYHQRVYSYKCALEGRVQSRALLLSGAHGTWHQKGAI
jgi:hypothetical protein